MTAAALMTCEPVWVTRPPRELRILLERRADPALADQIDTLGLWWWRTQPHLLHAVAVRFGDRQCHPRVRAHAHRACDETAAAAFDRAADRDRRARDLLGIDADPPKSAVHSDLAADLIHRLLGQGWPAGIALDELADRLCAVRLGQRLVNSCVYNSTVCARHLGPLERKLTRHEWGHVAQVAYEQAADWGGQEMVRLCAQTQSAQGSLWRRGRGRP